MPTIIDSLIVKLGFETKDIKDGTKVALESIKKIDKASKKSIDDKSKFQKKEISHLKEIAKRISILEKKSVSLSTGFGKTFAVAAGATGFVALSKSLINTAADVGRLSKNLMISTNNLAKWQNAVRMVGGESEDTNSTLMNLQKSLTALKFGEYSQEAGYLSALGISPSMSKEDALMKLREYFMKSPRDVGISMAERTGISESMYNLLTSDRFEQIMRDAAKSSENFESATEKAQKAQQEIINLQQRLFNLFLDWTPKLLDSVERIADYIGAKRKPVEDFIQRWEEKDEKIGKELRNKRNLNPGNIEYGEIAKHYGGELETGVENPRFAKFKDASSGVAALYSLLIKYKKQGLNTIEKIVPKYAPPGENNVKSVISNWSQKSGLKPGQEIDLSNLKQVNDLIRSITTTEGGGFGLRDEDIYGGIQKSGAFVSGDKIVNIDKVYVSTPDASTFVKDLNKMPGKTGVMNTNSGTQ